MPDRQLPPTPAHAHADTDTRGASGQGGARGGEWRARVWQDGSEKVPRGLRRRTARSFQRHVASTAISSVEGKQRSSRSSTRAAGRASGSVGRAISAEAESAISFAERMQPSNLSIARLARSVVGQLATSVRLAVRHSLRKLSAARWRPNARRRRRSSRWVSTLTSAASISARTATSSVAPTNDASGAAKRAAASSIVLASAADGDVGSRPSAPSATSRNVARRRQTPTACHARRRARHEARLPSQMIASKRPAVAARCSRKTNPRASRIAHEQSPTCSATSRRV